MNAARLAAAAATALGAWDAVWYALLHPTTALRPVLGATLLAAPLFMVALAAWRGTRLGLGVTGFVAVAYLAHGLMEYVANPAERGAAGIACGLALALWVLTMHALRVRRGRGD